MSSSAIRAGAAYIELTLRDRVSKGLHNASLTLKQFGDSVAMQGAKIAALGASITAPLVAMAHASVEALSEMGPGIDPRAAGIAREYVSALSSLTKALAAVRNAVATAVLPILTKQAEFYATLIESAAKWARENQELIATIFKFGAALTLAGTAIGFVGLMISKLGSVLGVLATITSAFGTLVGWLGAALAALMSPIGLVVAAVVGLAAYLLYTSGAGKAALDWLAEGFASLMDDALAAWQGIGDALAAGNIALAAEILWLTLKMEWQKGVHALNQIWVGIKSFMLSLWNDVVFGIARAWNNGWALVESSLVDSIAFLSGVLDDFQARFRKGWGWITDEIAKGMLEVQGMFDPTLDVEGAKANVDEDRKRKNAEIDAGVTTRAEERENNRKAEQKRINDENTAANNGLAAEQARREQEAQAKFDGELQQTKDQKDKAEAAWKASLAEAAKQRKDRERNKEMPGLGAGLQAEQQKLESKGTFNALAARGLGADSLAERTAKASEKVADNTKRLLDEAMRGGLLFT